MESGSALWYCPAGEHAAWSITISAFVPLINAIYSSEKEIAKQGLVWRYQLSAIESRSPAGVLSS